PPPGIADDRRGPALAAGGRVPELQGDLVRPLQPPGEEQPGAVRGEPQRDGEKCRLIGSGRKPLTAGRQVPEPHRAVLRVYHTASADIDGPHGGTDDLSAVRGEEPACWLQTGGRPLAQRPRW